MKQTNKKSSQAVTRFDKTHHPAFFNLTQVWYIRPYYMASSTSRQDEPNPALWLATWAGKMELSCPLRTTLCNLQEKFPWKPYNKSFIDQACSVKMAGYWPRFLAGQYQAIMTSCLVNNPYILRLVVGLKNIEDEMFSMLLMWDKGNIWFLKGFKPITPLT